MITLIRRRADRSRSDRYARARSRLAVTGRDDDRRAGRVVVFVERDLTGDYRDEHRVRVGVPAGGAAAA